MRRGVIQRLKDIASEDLCTRLRSGLPKPAEYYLDDKILNHPLFALCKLARLSEFLLARVRHDPELSDKGTCGVPELYMRVRDRIKYLVTTGDPEALRRRKNLWQVRGEAERMLALTKVCVSRLGIPTDVKPRKIRTSGAADNHCPFCHGKGMTLEQKRMFKYALLKMIETGVLSESFKIFA